MKNYLTRFLATSILIVFLVFSIAACGSKHTNNPTPASTTNQSWTDNSGPILELNEQQNISYLTEPVGSHPEWRICSDILKLEDFEGKTHIHVTLPELNNVDPLYYEAQYIRTTPQPPSEFYSILAGKLPAKPAHDQLLFQFPSKSILDFIRNIPADSKSGTLQFRFFDQKHVLVASLIFSI